MFQDIVHAQPQIVVVPERALDICSDEEECHSCVEAQREEDSSKPTEADISTKLSQAFTRISAQDIKLSTPFHDIVLMFEEIVHSQPQIVVVAERALDICCDEEELGSHSPGGRRQQQRHRCRHLFQTLSSFHTHLCTRHQTLYPASRYRSHV